MATKKRAAAKKARSFTDKVGNMSAAAVAKATGKTWDDWLRILDAAGAKEWQHPRIATYVHETYPDVGGWWAQAVTVGYEKARGLRADHQRAGHWSVSSSKTIAAPIARVWAAFVDDEARKAWLGRAKHEVRGATKHKSFRVTWGDGSNVVVGLYDKGAKTQVALQHDKLKDRADVDAKKAFWTRALGKLKARLEA